MAGGVWSPARFRDHGLTPIEADFSSCVGQASSIQPAIGDFSTRHLLVPAPP